jgi:DNA/RNA endonuclease YhcR with UshA esterase domain
LGIAHGDLHPANIKVRNGDLTLIDYDGMYLPQLASLKPNQIGHFNFQHPQRSDCHYGPEIDRFSTLVIYTGMQSLIVRPNLWKKYGTSENLLFGSQDFLEPEKSNLFRELRGITQIKPFADKLLDICKLPIENVPRLKDFLNPQFNLPTAPLAQIMTVTIQRQYPIIEAFDTETLLKHIGQKVEVIGYVTNLHSAIDKNQKRYAFLFLKSDKTPSLALTIWPRALEYFEQQGISPEIYVKKWVSVTGLITSYLNKPQIEITMPSEIQILADYKEASQRLGRPVPKIAKPKIQNDFNSRGRKSKTIDVQTIRKLSQPYSKAKPSGILGWIRSILRAI